MTTQVHDSYLPIYIVLACCLVCVVTLTCLAVLELWDRRRDLRDRKRHAEAVDAASRLGPNGEPFDVWNRQMLAQRRSRCAHPSNRGRKP